MDKKEVMIEHHLKGRDIYDDKVLEAMRATDRIQFVPDEMKQHAYDDGPLPIGKGQTISQPYIVAYMAQTLDLQPTDKVLEIGSGCGYNAAVMAHIVSHVYSLEIIEWLADLARANLEKAGISNVTVDYGNGYEGWPDQSPFDKIVLTAAAPFTPDTLKKQLKTGGKMLAPVGVTFQNLKLIEKTDTDRFQEQNLIGVRFVPMTGE